MESEGETGGTSMKNSGGQEPVLVYLDRIYLLAEPETQVEGYTEDAVQKTKKSRIHDMEMKMLESKQILTTEMNKSWLGSFINTIIGNLKLSISSIHIRYEDLESNPGHPFAAGVTLEKLSASTVDDSGKEAFVTGGALDLLNKFDQKYLVYPSPNSEVETGFSKNSKRPSYDELETLKGKYAAMEQMLIEKNIMPPRGDTSEYGTFNHSVGAVS